MNGPANKIMHDIIDESFNEQVAAAQAVIRVKSVLDESAASPEHPFGPDLTRCLGDFLQRAEEMGFRTKNVDNYAGYAEMGDAGELIGILVHLDVVPEGRESDWQYAPYAAVVKDGALHGRGSIDDKGPAVAALYAMKALRDSGAGLNKRFRLILGLDEESGSRCILHYNEHEEIPSFSFSPDAEFPVVNAEKGILRVTLTKSAEAAPDEDASLISVSGGVRFNVVPDNAAAVIKRGCAAGLAAPKLAGIEISETPQGVTLTARGVSAHAMEPHKGENAVQKLLACLTGLKLSQTDKSLIDAIYALAGSGYDGRGFGIDSRDEISGPLTCNLAAVEMDVSGGLRRISAKLDIRYPVTADSDEIIGKIRLSAGKAGCDVQINTHKKPLYIAESHKAVQILMDAYESVTGERPAPISMGGGTYCRFMPNAVSAGPLFPGEPELAHQANEHVTLENLRKSTHIYAEALDRFNG